MCYAPYLLYISILGVQQKTCSSLPLCLRPCLPALKEHGWSRVATGGNTGGHGLQRAVIDTYTYVIYNI